MSLEDLYPIDRIRHIPFLYYPNVNTETDRIDDEGRREVLGALRQPAGTPRKAALYVHVPFCKNHCTFCFYNIEIVKHPRHAELRAVLRDPVLADPIVHLGNLGILRGSAAI